MVLDECLAHPVRRAGRCAQSMERTLRWARRARERFLASARGAVDGVIVTQPRTGAVRHRAGGRRTRSCARRARAGRSTIGFEAYAIGGLSVGEPTDVMYDVVVAHDAVAAGRPAALSDGRGHARGSRRVGGAGRRPVRLRAADPERPERPALHQRRAASTSRTRGMPRTTGRPIRPAAATPAGRCSRAYLRHLFQAGEINAATLNTLHNLHFYLDTMRRIREAIAFGRFESFRLAFHQSLSRRPNDCA